ncbi:hypothetical protein LCGC14_0986650, partial [marine sediment metagenome]
KRKYLIRVIAYFYQNIDILKIEGLSLKYYRLSFYIRKYQNSVTIGVKLHVISNFSGFVS